MIKNDRYFGNKVVIKMAKPIFSGSIVPFDAKKDYVVKIGWSGDRAYSNRLIIYNSDDLSVVFDDTVVSFTLSHTIPANTLTNGGQWIMQCQVFDQDGIESVLSDKLFFYTFETPTFQFSNVYNGKTIEAASYSAVIGYSQANNEAIYSYQFALYDAAKNLIRNSLFLHYT